MKDPYSTLGVARSASEKDIKSAYRKLAKELHPDRNTGNPQAESQFKEANEAYQTLSEHEFLWCFHLSKADGQPA